MFAWKCTHTFKYFIPKTIKMTLCVITCVKSTTATISIINESSLFLTQLLITLNMSHFLVFNVSLIVITPHNFFVHPLSANSPHLTYTHTRRTHLSPLPGSFQPGQYSCSGRAPTWSKGTGELRRRGWLTAAPERMLRDDGWPSRYVMS